MNDLSPAASNTPEYTVSEIAGAVKRTLEGAFGRVRVRGEITELKRYSSGHIYLCLKDEGAKMRGVAWRSAVPRLGMSPENGVEVIATGRLSSYPERSEYQLIIERLEYAGAGALLARIELLRQRLAAEGLFEAARKRALPMLPLVIGVVTSAQGAVIQDIRTTITRRFPRRLLLWPVAVQGEGAAASRIAAAIARVRRDRTRRRRIPRPDVVIVARGGGSLEDLMAFNEEVVVRAAAACRIPLISAVGHETDTTLDRLRLRPTRADADGGRRAGGAGARRPHRGLAEQGGTPARRAEPTGAGTSPAPRVGRRGACRTLPALIGTARQRADDRAERLRLALPNLLAARRAALLQAERFLPDLPQRLRACAERVEDRSLRLLLALPNLVASRRAELERLESASRATSGHRG